MHYLKTAQVLKRKYKYHLLSARKLQMLYLSYIGVGTINKYNIGNELATMEYQEMAEDILLDADELTYLHIV